jgi:hypothetical protein
MMEIVKGLGSETRILVASIRTAESMALLAVKEGLVDTFTFDPDVARMRFDEPLTNSRTLEFHEAAIR